MTIGVMTAERSALANLTINRVSIRDTASIRKSATTGQ